MQRAVVVRPHFHDLTREVHGDAINPLDIAHMGNAGEHDLTHHHGRNTGHGVEPALLVLSMTGSSTRPDAI